MSARAVIAINQVKRPPIFTLAGRKNNTRASATQIARPMNIRLAPVSFFDCSRTSIALAIRTSRGRSASSWAVWPDTSITAVTCRTFREQNCSRHLQHTYFVAELFCKLLGYFRGRAFDHFCFLGLLRDVQALDLLQIFVQGRLDFGHGHLAHGLVLGLLDPDEGGIAQLIDAGLDGQHGRQRHVDILEVAGLEFALYADAAILFLDLHNDGGVRPAE